MTRPAYTVANRNGQEAYKNAPPRTRASALPSRFMEPEPRRSLWQRIWGRG